MISIEQIRQQYPQYSDMSDTELARALHSRHYSDMDFSEFSQRLGLQNEARNMQQSMGRSGLGAPPSAEEQGQTLKNIGTVGVKGLRRFVDNLLSVPRVAGEGLAAAGALPQAAIESGAAAVRGEQGNFQERFSQRFEEGKEQFPASALIDAGQLDTGQIAADVRAVGQEDFGRARKQELEAQILRDAEFQDQAPGLSLAGQVLGDVGTIVAGRAPIARARAPQQAARRQRELAKAKEEAPGLPPHVERELNDVVSSRIAPLFKTGGERIQRGLGRTAETGIEGATLALLNEGDPVATGAFAAGGQAAGSLALTLVERPIVRLGAAVATVFVASEMFKAAAPGVEQNLFKSKDFAINKAAAAFALGTAAGLMGMGRFRSPTAERFPAIFDAMTAAPRTAAISTLLRDFVNESEKGNDTPVKVAETLYRNPDHFNRNQRNSLMRAADSGKDGAFIKEVERLLEQSPSFREKLEEL